MRQQRRWVAALSVASLVLVSCATDQGDVDDAVGSSMPSTAATAADAAVRLDDDEPSAAPPSLTQESGSDVAGTADRDDEDNASDAASVTSSHDASSSGSPDKAAVTPAASRLAPAMLGPRDVPQGWERVERPDQDEHEDTGEDRGGGGPPEMRICNETEFGDGLTFEAAKDAAGAVFRRAVFGPYATSIAATLPAGEVAGLLDDLGRAARSCRTWTQVDDDGTQTIFTIDVFDAGTLGDQSVAFGLTIQRAALRFDTDVVLWRHGAIGAAVIHAGTAGSVDRTLTRSMATAVSRRLAQLA